MKLNGTHQVLVYADDVNILGGRVQTIKKNAKVLVVAIKETGLRSECLQDWILGHVSRSGCRTKSKYKC